MIKKRRKLEIFVVDFFIEATASGASMDPTALPSKITEIFGC
jgi:hypothetical protein